MAVKSNLANLTKSPGMSPLEQQLVKRNVGGNFMRMEKGNISNPVPKLSPPSLRQRRGPSIRIKTALQPKLTV